jgi:K+-transporting ATPase ATPase A chain
MTDTTAGLLQIGALVAALAICYRPLGGYMARVFTSERDLRAERVIYRMVGVDPRADQRWTVYCASVIAFSFVGVVALFALQRLQSALPWSLGFPGVDPALAFNTAASFVTNTNWQAYSGESTMGHLTQMAGLAVQNFISAAVGIAVAVAVIRGFMRSRTDRIGNFWVDLVRAMIRILVPLAVLAAVALIAMGAIQNLSSGTTVTTLAGGHQTLTGGPVASQEAIKELGTNGGGFYGSGRPGDREDLETFPSVWHGSSRLSRSPETVAPAPIRGAKNGRPVASSADLRWHALGRDHGLWPPSPERVPATLLPQPSAPCRPGAA